jgi:hypothetical protein
MHKGIILNAKVIELLLDGVKLLIAGSGTKLKENMHQLQWVREYLR